MKIVHIIWKAPVVIVALLIGALAANQAGWSGAELVVTSQLMGPLEDLVTAIFFSLGAAVSAGTVR
jgi:hypothetical protein